MTLELVSFLFVSPYGQKEMVDIDIPFWVCSSIKSKIDFILRNSTIIKETTIIENKKTLLKKMFFIEEDLIAIIFYNEENQIHRNNDLPAILHYDNNENINGQEWLIQGKRHRENDLPAVIGSEFGKVWFINNLIQRNNFKESFINYKGIPFYIINGQSIPKSEALKKQIKYKINNFS
jgi:hypothetical protein